MTIYAVVTSGGTVGSLSQFDSTSVVFGQPVQFIKDASSIPSTFEGAFSTWTQLWSVSDITQLTEAVVDEIGGAILLLTGSGDKLRSLATGNLIQTFPSQTEFGKHPYSIRGVYSVIGTSTTSFTVVKNGSVLFTSPALGIFVQDLAMSYSGKYILVMSQVNHTIQLWVGS